jgi:hypothetical protein
MLALYLARGTQRAAHPHVRSGENLILDALREFTEQPGITSQYPANPCSRAVSLPDFRQNLNQRTRITLVSPIALRSSHSKQTYLRQRLYGLVMQASVLFMPLSVGLQDGDNLGCAANKFCSRRDGGCFHCCILLKIRHVVCPSKRYYEGSRKQYGIYTEEN